MRVLGPGTILVLLPLLGGLAPPAVAAGESSTGDARAVDATSLILAGARYRLAGIEARPDAGSQALADLLAGGPVTCSRDRRLGHGFYQGRCRDAAGADLGEALVRAGAARAAAQP